MDAAKHHTRAVFILAQNGTGIMEFAPVNHHRRTGAAQHGSCSQKLNGLGVNSPRFKSKPSEKTRWCSNRPLVGQMSAPKEANSFLNEEIL